MGGNEASPACNREYVLLVFLLRCADLSKAPFHDLRVPSLQAFSRHASMDGCGAGQTRTQSKGAQAREAGALCRSRQRMETVLTAYSLPVASASPARFKVAHTYLLR